MSYDYFYLQIYGTSGYVDIFSGNKFQQNPMWVTGDLDCHINLWYNQRLRDKHGFLGGSFHYDIFYIHKWTNSTCFQESIKNYSVTCCRVLNWVNNVFNFLNEGYRRLIVAPNFKFLNGYL